MFDTKRPASLAMAGRRRNASLRARKHPSNTQNRQPLQTAHWHWPWLQIGQIATEIILPKVAAARERDRVARLRLGLPLINWATQS
jgi:hypothetical protein